MGSSLSWARDQEDEERWAAGKAKKDKVVKDLKEMNHESMDNRVDDILRGITEVIGSAVLRNEDFERLKRSRKLIKELFQRE
jgi:hypothetical protein